MGASITHLRKLDSVQQAAERTFPLLSSCQKASAISLLCKLLDGQCRGPLHNFGTVLVLSTPNIRNKMKYINT